jgi:hypothetical protein
MDADYWKNEFRKADRYWKELQAEVDRLTAELRALKIQLVKMDAAAIGDDSMAGELARLRSQLVIQEEYGERREVQIKRLERALEQANLLIED